MKRLGGVESERFAPEALFEGLPAKQLHHDDVHVLAKPAFLREASPVPHDAGVPGGHERVGAAFEPTIRLVRVVPAHRHDLQRDDLSGGQPRECAVAVARGGEKPPLPALSGEFADDREVAYASLGGFGHRWRGTNALLRYAARRIGH